MKDSSRNISPSTVAFACLEPEVALLIVDIIQALVSVLRWRQVSQSLLIAILSRLAESPQFEMTHAEFAALLWVHLGDSARKEKFSKWTKKMREDMQLSNCPAVRISLPRPEKDIKGQWRNLPTMYTPGIFWQLFRAVQDAAMECDLMLEKDVKKRRAKVRAIVATWLHANGAVQIERVRTEEAKPPKASPPCRCNCASCASCAAKSATASEAENGVRLSERSGRITTADVERCLEQSREMFFQGAQVWLNLGLGLGDYVKKAYAGFEIEELRVREAVKRVNKNGLKLVGGQPK